MRRILLAGCAALALGGAAHANIVDDSGHAWVLVGLDWVNSVGLYARQDMASDVGTTTESPGAMPMFQTRRECDLALKRVLSKYKGVSHAAGGFGFFLCSPLSAWARRSF